MSNIISTGPGSSRKNNGKGRFLHWLARLGSLAVVTLLVFMMTGGNGTDPTGRDWLYLALFPAGFSIGYLIGWKWALAGGVISLTCMILSLLVVGRSFELETYIGWVLLSLPGVLFLIAGFKQRYKR